MLEFNLGDGEHTDTKIVHEHCPNNVEKVSCSFFEMIMKNIKPFMK